MFFGKIGISMVAILAVLGCASGKGALALATEYPDPNEQVVMGELADFLIEGVKRRGEPGSYRRDAHPKHHGCVKATFSVPSLPEDLRVGVFQDTKDYQSYIRFSNGSGMKPDYEKNIRGMAIKLTGVEGEKLLEDEKDAKTQDFLLINHNVLVAKDATDFLKLARSISEGSPLGFFLNPLDSHLREFGIFLDTVRNYPNLFEIRYFSTTPYRFGQGRAVKYSARPCKAGRSVMPENPGENYLRERMLRDLSQGEACFDFMVQFQTDPYEMLIEDARSAWDEEVSPFRKVATVRIPQQKFDSPKQMEFCENLSFTPWHSLPAHRPLGNVNRARKHVYREVSKFRHEGNGVPREEPDGNETF